MVFFLVIIVNTPPRNNAAMPIAAIPMAFLRFSSGVNSRTGSGVEVLAGEIVGVSIGWGDWTGVSENDAGAG